MSISVKRKSRFTKRTKILLIMFAIAVLIAIVVGTCFIVGKKKKEKN